MDAYILIQALVGKAGEVSQEIAAIPGVVAVDVVSGPYDVIVRVQTRTIDQLGQLVAGKIQGVEGISRTLTCPVPRF